MKVQSNAALMFVISREDSREMLRYVAEWDAGAVRNLEVKAGFEGPSESLLSCCDFYFYFS